MRDAKGLLIGACAHVEQVDIGLELLRDAHALVHVVATLAELRTTQAELDGEERPHGLAHGLQHADGKAAAVLQAAAVLVGTVVEERREELVDEPAMPAVNHEHLKASALGKTSNVAIGGDDLVDHLVSQGTHGHAVCAGAVAWPPLRKSVLLGLVGHIGAGKLAGVRELERRDGTMTTNGVGGVGCAGKRVEDALVQVVGMAAVRCGMHHQLGHGDRRGTALAA